MKLSILLVALSLVVGVFSQNDPVVQKVLLDLYTSTQGPAHWIRQRGWGTTDPYCTWDGILCKGATFSLDLRANDLIGTIPNTLGLLSQSITSLLLDENRLTGTVPSSFANLTNLVQLDVAQNNLTGSIPDGLGRLTKLELFWFSDNQFVGAIPVDLQFLLPQVAQYQSTQGCRLAGNAFCCPVPSWVPAECGMGCNITQSCTENIRSSIAIN